VKAYRIYLALDFAGSLTGALAFTVAAVYFVREAHFTPLQLVLNGTGGLVFAVAAYWCARTLRGAGVPLYGRALRQGGEEPELEALPLPSDA
jgi:hypothetical protein